MLAISTSGTVCSSDLDLKGGGSRTRQQPQPDLESVGSNLQDADSKSFAGPNNNVNGLRHAMRDPPRRYESWLVLEYADRGCARSYLFQWPPPAVSRDDGSVLRVLHLLLDTAQGLEQLHRRKVVHGDLVSTYSTCS